MFHVGVQVRHELDLRFGVGGGWGGLNFDGNGVPWQLPFCVLAIGMQESVCFLVALGEGPADAAAAGQLAARAAASAQQQRIRGRAEPAQRRRAFIEEADLLVAADLADGHLPVRVGVEERVPGVAAGEHLPRPQVRCRLRGQRCRAAVDRG